MISDGYPLKYPQGRQRTKSPSPARFGKKTLAYVSLKLMEQIGRLKGSKVVISCNLMIKPNGVPYANQRKPEDCGVAVYFTKEGKEQCFPCDRWNTVEDNIWAIVKSIEAIRGLDRWGSKDMVESAFKGFEALPSPEMVSKPSIRYFSECKTLDEAKETYRNLLHVLHPDKGGKPEDFVEMNTQYNQFKETLK